MDAFKEALWLNQLFDGVKAFSWWFNFLGGDDVVKVDVWDIVDKGKLSTKKDPVNCTIWYTETLTAWYDIRKRDDGKLFS